MPNTQLPKSKRLRIALYVFHLYIAIGIFAIYRQADLAQLAAYMAATSIPIITYILGDTFRPSNP